METKQIIVVRKDLKMRMGKVAAQVAHASMGAIKNNFMIRNAPFQVTGYNMAVIPGTALEAWWEGSFTKIVLGCDDLAALEEIEQQCLDLGLPICKITDSGKTEFNNVPTITCLAIGPCILDAFTVTSHLKPL